MDFYFDFFKKAAFLGFRYVSPFCFVVLATLQARAQSPDSLDKQFDLLENTFSKRNFRECFSIIANMKKSAADKPYDDFAAMIDRWEGNVYAELGYFEKAEQHLKSSLAYWEKAGKRRNQGIVLFELDFMEGLRHEHGHRDNEYLNRAIEIFESIRDTAYLIASYDNLGYSFSESNDFSRAIHYGQKAESLMDTSVIALTYPNIYTNLGEYYYKTSIFGLAEQNLFTAIRLSDKVNLDYVRLSGMDARRILGQVWLKTGRREAGMALLEEALAYARRFNEPLLLKNTYENLIADAIEHGNYVSAYARQRAFFELRDSLHREELGVQFERSQVMLEVGKREVEYNLLQQNLAEQRQQQRFAWVLAFLGIALAVAVFFLYFQKQRFNQNLRVEVERQTEALRQSNTELERFAYVASHDLRTPVRNVVSFTGLLQRKLREHPDADVRRFSTYAREYALHLDQLLNDILVFHKIGKPKFDTGVKADAVDMNQVAQKTVHALGDAIRSRQADIQVESLPVVRGESEKMERLLQNLVENGLKFNEQPQPRIRIRAEQNCREHRFCIEDNGIGIEPEYQKKVFEMFTRLHTLDQYNGTGLGLAICKKIVEQAGGKIWLDSQKGAGTKVFFTLPAA